MSIATPVLSVRNLRTTFFTRGGALKAVNNVSFDVATGEVIGLVGESGSGKSITGMSIMGLVEPPGRTVGGEVFYQGENLLAMPEGRLRRLRGNRLAMVFQDPMMSLNPVLRIDVQMIETVQAHEKVSRRAARARARDALARVGIPAPEARLTSYPHQLSGGMRQRVAIAMALLHGPDVLIADEPTTALDVTIQAQILYEIQKLCRDEGTAVIWITHDLSVVANLAQRICVMYAGQIVEAGPVGEVIDHPQHPYTDGLIRSLPSENPRGRPLHQIPGTTPSPLAIPPGCAFRNRCERATTACLREPDVEAGGPGRVRRCHHPLNLVLS